MDTNKRQALRGGRMSDYEVGRQCAQKFHPPSTNELANTISSNLSSDLIYRGLNIEIAENVSTELSDKLIGGGLAIDIAEAMANIKKDVEVTRLKDKLKKAYNMILEYDSGDITFLVQQNAALKDQVAALSKRWNDEEPEPDESGVVE